MSILVETDYEGRSHFDDIDEQVCFLCGGHLFKDTKYSTGGVVHWMGSNGNIFLHQPCAERLGVNLIQDARSLVTTTKRLCKMDHKE